MEINDLTHVNSLRRYQASLEAMKEGEKVYFSFDEEHNELELFTEKRVYHTSLRVVETCKLNRMRYFVINVEYTDYGTDLTKKVSFELSQVTYPKKSQVNRLVEENHHYADNVVITSIQELSEYDYKEYTS